MSDKDIWPGTLRRHTLSTRHTLLTAVACSWDVAASQPFSCCCEQQRRCLTLRPSWCTIAVSHVAPAPVVQAQLCLHRQRNAGTCTCRWVHLACASWVRSTSICRWVHLAPGEYNEAVPAMSTLRPSWCTSQTHAPVDEYIMPAPIVGYIACARWVRSTITGR